MFKNKTVVLASSLLLFALLFTSCSPNDTDEDYEPKYLLSYHEVETLSKEQITANLSLAGELPSEIAFMIRLGVKGIRITYETVSITGEKIEASGALLIPVVTNPMPIISFQHGTITSENYAPSNFFPNANLMAYVFASTGYIIAMPDYIGYGASKDLPHPYEHRASLATATRDMIRAAYEYFKVKKVNQPSNKLFLTGYSEGGFATMATFKLIQEEHSTEFNITAVSVGAGAYNKTEFVSWIVNSTIELEHINSFVWVLDVYNSNYATLNRPYEHYFNEPWADIISQNGVFADIEQNPSILFKSSFIESIRNQSDTQLLLALSNNNCYDWKPNKPLQLYHGTNDSYVPYFNSETAYSKMIQNGATSVELIPINGGTHSSSISEYAMGTFMFFNRNLN
jgi:alpha-beta hydrolase superfamily lysophospholipase